MKRKWPFKAGEVENTKKKTTPSPLLYRYADHIFHYFAKKILQHACIWAVIILYLATYGRQRYFGRSAFQLFYIIYRAAAAVLKKAAPPKCLKQHSSGLEVYKRQLTQANLHQLTSFTGNEGLVRIHTNVWFRFMRSQKLSCLALLFPKQNYKDLSTKFYMHVSVSELYIPGIALPILLQPNRQTDPGNI